MKNVDPSTTSATGSSAASPSVASATNSHGSADVPSDNSALLRECDVLAKLLLNVREVAFLLRVGVRTVWRMVSDPRSGFPTPRRFRRRTLFARDEVLAFMTKGGGSR